MFPPDATSLNQLLSIRPFPKKLNPPLKQVFRGHFGPQAKFSGRNTVFVIIGRYHSHNLTIITAQTTTLIFTFKVVRMQTFNKMIKDTP